MGKLNPKWISANEWVESKKSAKLIKEQAGVVEPMLIPKSYMYPTPVAELLPPAEKEEEMPKVSPPVFCYHCKTPMCKICHACEDPDCKLNGQWVVSRADLVAQGLAVPRSQKATGFLGLERVMQVRVPRPHLLLSEDEDVENFDGAKFFGGAAFFRPCPVRPRHGFVESRVLPATKESAQLMWKETRAADPEGEVLVCKPINAAYNVVITPSLLSIGPGNDGATAGKDCFSFPLLSTVNKKDINPETLRTFGVDIDKEDPYIELVAESTGVPHNFGWYYTQVRAGAKAPKTPDYIPKRIKVERILVASGDLLEWEKQTERIDPGTVVVHVGGVLTSHYGVHCLTNGVPILTTRMPEVGETLEKTGSTVVFDYEAISRGLAAGVTMPLWHTPSEGANSTIRLSGSPPIAKVLPLMMSSLHNAPALGWGSGMWLGAGVGFMLRAGMAASHGEARHADFNTKHNLSRESIYRRALAEFFSCRETLGIAQFAFKFHKWGGSFGGTNWANCTDSLFRLDKSARDFLKDPSEKARRELVNALNNAVNQAHNGGWWLNKFVEKDTFNAAAGQNMRALLSAASVIPFVGDYILKQKEEDWKAVARKWAESPDIEIRNGNHTPKLPTIAKDKNDRPIKPNATLEEMIEQLASPPKIEPPKTPPPCTCSACTGKVGATKVGVAKPIAEKIKELDSLPIVPPVAYTSLSGGKAKKIPFSASSIPSALKAHIRWEDGGGYATGHLQVLYANGKYASADTGAVLYDKFGVKPDFSAGEVSYSSASKGYTPLLILSMTSVLVDEKHEIGIKVNSYGTLTIKGNQSGQTKEE